MKNIETMRTSNGHFTVNKKEYILIEQAYFNPQLKSGFGETEYDNYYTARAISIEDSEDEDGFRKCYIVHWEVLDNYNPETENDEERACDWDSPSEVKECGEYNLKTGIYY